MIPARARHVTLLLCALGALACVALPGWAQPEELRRELKSRAYKRFIAAASVGDLDTVKQSVKFGLDPNASLAYPPLLAAACADRVEVVRYLLSIGARTDVEGKGGGTPLECALRSGNQELIRLLSR